MRRTCLGDNPSGVDACAFMSAAVSAPAGIHDKVDTMQVESAHSDNIRLLRERGARTHPHNVMSGQTQGHSERGTDLAQRSHDHNPHLGTFSR
jgi:hypothetical protein